MRSNRALTTVLTLATILLSGCIGEQMTTTSSMSGNDQSNNWVEINFSSGKSGDTQNFSLSGKRQTLVSVIDHIRDRIEKPIRIADDVDPEKMVPSFSIEIPKGTWADLLGQIAQKFGCSLKETDDEFVFSSSVAPN